MKQIEADEEFNRAEILRHMTQGHLETVEKLRIEKIGANLAEV